MPMKENGLCKLAEECGELPPAYGRKEYQDLNFEERRVVDSFQTEKEYGEIVARSDYYIVKDAKALLN